MEEPRAPLNYEASSEATHMESSTTLPPEVVQCLKNTRFLHLATCDSLFPHVSLMNYTYLPSSPFTPYPTIVMTTNPSSKKTNNLVRNPHVSLLVHDWVSQRPPTIQTDMGRGASPPREAPSSSLATLLLNLNTSALSSISATINGDARMLDRGTDEEKYFKDRHLANNTFDDQVGGQAQGQQGAGLSLLGTSPDTVNHEGDGGRGCFIEGEEVRVVVVRVREGRIADWKGGVKDWTLIDEETSDGGPREQLVNGLVGV